MSVETTERVQPEEAYARARDRLLSLQRADGSWEGEMAWNTMILSQYVITLHLLGRTVPAEERARMVRHYEAVRLPDDGWGLHAASATASPYCTALAYTALRLLGAPPDDPLCVRARAWLHRRPEGPAALPTWGRFWLALLGVVPYGALHPMPPEVFLLPRGLPLHPDRLYCHTRSIARSMAYLYGVRFRAGDPELAAALRAELFAGHVFTAADRNRTGPDAVAPATWGLRLLRAASAAVEHCTLQRLRERSLRECLRRVRHEHTVTDRLGLSPVNTLLDLLVLSHAGTDPAELDTSITAFDYWRLEDPRDGVRFVGARSQTWDTAFAVQALTCAPQPSAAADQAVARASDFLLRAQVREEIPDRSLSALTCNGRLVFQ
ncbi:hypothetical protein ACFVOK_31365 [Streptomyces sp. NPDC057798]|uniref:hypothetical protein n=1 Tax=Streptomyces sp. NPDC057798 TaxID=3346252 RepID=UPI00367FD590